MSSKKLSSILQKVPPATAQENINTNTQQRIIKTPTAVEKTRIVASIPKTLKYEIRQYIENNKGETETTIVLKGLKKMGFAVDNELLIDKRTLR